MVASLLALIVGPLLVLKTTADHRRQLDEVIEPAARAAADLESSIIRQGAAIRGYTLLPREHFEEDYRRAVADQFDAEERLLARADDLPRESALRFQIVRRRIDRWQVSPELLLEGRITTEELFGRFADQQALHVEALEEAEQLRRSIDRARDATLGAIARANQVFFGVAVVLGLLGLAAVLVVRHLHRRVQQLAAAYWEKAEAAGLLARVARDLMEEPQFDRLTAHIAETALRNADAAAAYVEHIDPERDEVVIVATAGDAAPRPGARAPFPGSLAEAVLRSAQVELVPDVSREQRPMANVLHDSCPGCHAMVVPLLSGGDPLGALVVLRSPDAPMFVPEQVPHVRTFADLAAILLRRRLDVQEAEARRSDAERALQARDDVLKVVSHDLRSPLASIEATAMQLERTGLTDGLVGKAALIRRSTRRMKRLIDDLLEVARLEAGQSLPLELAPVNVGELVDEVCEPAREVAAAKSIDLLREVPLGLPPMIADAARVHQILANLVDNALKFTPEGGRVAVRVRLAGDDVLFSVSDTGPGIHPSVSESIFEAFWQDHRRATGIGSGLGLAIARRLVERHGGYIRVESVPGEGATFLFTIPTVLRAEIDEELPAPKLPH